MIGEEFNEISTQVGEFENSDRTEKDNVINECPAWDQYKGMQRILQYFFETYWSLDCNDYYEFC